MKRARVDRAETRSSSCLWLPPDVRDHVLRFGGPLALAHDARRVAALRVQDAWRRRRVLGVGERACGLRVRYYDRRAPGAPDDPGARRARWRVARLARDAEDEWTLEHARGRLWVRRTHVLVRAAGREDRP